MANTPAPLRNLTTASSPLPRPPRGPCRSQQWLVTMRIRASRRPATWRSRHARVRLPRVDTRAITWQSSLRAFGYANKGDYDRAITDLSKAIRLDPANHEAFNNRQGKRGRRLSVKPWRGQSADAGLAHTIGASRPGVPTLSAAQELDVHAAK